MEPLPELSQLMDLPAVLAEVEADALPGEVPDSGPFPDLGLMDEVEDAPEVIHSPDRAANPQGEYFLVYNYTSPFSTGIFSWLFFSYLGFAFCDNDFLSIFFHLFIFLFQRRRTLGLRRPAKRAPSPGAPMLRWQGSSR